MRLKGLPTPVKVLLVTQMLFNVGFYLVVPFLAVHMTEAFGAGGALVGFVLGIRTFSQQGLFFLGGGLADRFGIKPVLLTGVALRIVGFLVAGLATSMSGMICGVVLIGVAAALFSPAVEAALATEGERLQRAGTASRSRLFALDAAWSRLGALTGPIIGALLIPVGFRTVCLVGAAVFVAILIVHAVVLSGDGVRGDGDVGKQEGIVRPMLGAWSRVLRNRAFVVFALAYSTYLLAYNMQYLALPVELRRATGSDELLGWFFAVIGVYVIALQGPVNSYAHRLRTATALMIGFGVMAGSFVVVAVCAPVALSGWVALLPAVVFVLLLHLGMMLAVPVARDVVGRLAGERDLGSYYGFLNSFGGLAVLLGSLGIGALLDRAEIAQAAATLPWLVMAVLLVVSAFVLGRQANQGPLPDVHLPAEPPSTK